MVISKDRSCCILLTSRKEQESLDVDLKGNLVSRVLLFPLQGEGEFIPESQDHVVCI